MEAYRGFLGVELARPYYVEAFGAAPFRQHCADKAAALKQRERERKGPSRCLINGRSSKQFYIG